LPSAILELKFVRNAVKINVTLELRLYYIDLDLEKGNS